MNWNKRVRQIHRWLAIAFTVAVIANFAAMTQGQPPAWCSPLLPLALPCSPACTCSRCRMRPADTAQRVEPHNTLEDEPWHQNQSWGTGAKRP